MLEREKRFFSSQTNYQIEIPTRKINESMTVINLHFLKPWIVCLISFTTLEINLMTGNWKRGISLLFHNNTKKEKWIRSTTNMLTIVHLLLSFWLTAVNESFGLTETWRIGVPNLGRNCCWCVLYCHLTRTPFCPTERMVEPKVQKVTKTISLASDLKEE